MSESNQEWSFWPILLEISQGMRMIYIIGTLVASFMGFIPRKVV
jgi:hypothetical protein